MAEHGLRLRHLIASRERQKNLEETDHEPELEIDSNNAREIGKDPLSPPQEQDLKEKEKVMEEEQLMDEKLEYAVQLLESCQTMVEVSNTQGAFTVSHHIIYDCMADSLCY